MAELTRLRAIITAGATSATSSQNYVLGQYLDNLTSYAESVCNDVAWDSDDSQLTPSRKLSLENVGGSGGVAGLPTEHGDGNVSHGLSRPSTTAAVYPGSPQAAALSTSGQVPYQECPNSTHHALPTSQPRKAAIRPHQDPGIFATRKIEMNTEAAPLPAIPPVDKSKLAIVGSAPSTSGETEVMKKILIFGDDDVEKSTVYK